jgi:hypothetical protein
VRAHRTAVARIAVHAADQLDQGDQGDHDQGDTPTGSTATTPTGSTVTGCVDVLHNASQDRPLG